MQAGKSQLGVTQTIKHGHLFKFLSVLPFIFLDEGIQYLMMLCKRLNFLLTWIVLTYLCIVFQHEGEEVRKLDKIKIHSPINEP